MLSFKVFIYFHNHVVIWNFAGYVLLGLAKNAGNQYTDLVNQRMSNNWRERTFQVGCFDFDFNILVY